MAASTWPGGAGFDDVWIARHDELADWVRGAGLSDLSDRARFFADRGGPS